MRTRPAPKQTLRTRLAAAEERACQPNATAAERAAAASLFKCLLRGGK